MRFSSSASICLLAAGCTVKSSVDPADGGGVIPIVDAAANSDAALIDAGADVATTMDSGEYRWDAGPHGHVIFTMSDDYWYSIEAREGAPMDDITTRLDNLSPALRGTSGRSDSFISLSGDGEWFVLNTSRFGCSTTQCVAVANASLTAGERIRINSVELLAASSRSAIGKAGTLVVFAKRGVHDLDLYATTRDSNSWKSPVLLTGDSPHRFHHEPFLSLDGSKVIFDCGDTSPYQEPDTSICEVGTDGRGFKVLATPMSHSSGSSNNGLHHPAYLPTGPYIFEADWESEQIWRMNSPDQAPVKISPPSFTDDNSPCVLADGRIVSLWLGRAENPTNLHELKVMNSDGSGFFMLVTLKDIVDIGISCGR